MGKLADFAAKLFGGAGTSTPKNQILLKDGTYGSELYSLLAGSASGVAVSEKAALSTSAVYASVGLIGGAVASLPLHIYRRTADGRERYETDLWYLFNESPAPAWTSASAWHYTIQSILLKGDSFWWIKRRGRYTNDIEALVPIHPDNVSVEQKDGVNIYTMRLPDGTVTVRPQDDVLHFTGLGFDGKRSLTPIQYALRNAAGTTIAADEYAGNFFKGGARPDHALEVPADVKLSPEQRELLKQTWGRQRSGYAESGSTPVLTGGMKVVSLSMNAEDAQLLQTRQFGVEEIARIFGIPPHMIGKTDASTSWGSGIEQMGIGFVRYTLRRHLDMIQQEINRKLWPRSRIFFAEFNTDALLEGDSKAQADYFSKALGGPGAQGWMTVNEVRKLKNMKPIEGGDAISWAGTSNDSPQEEQNDPADSEMAALRSRIEAVASAEKPAPVINVHPTINIENKQPEAPSVTVVNQVPEQPAPVVQNVVNVPEPVVNVEAVMPSQEAPVVNVAPAHVDVHNNVVPKVEVSLPNRKTETTIVRDSKGNIVKATQLEEDA